MNIDIKHIMPSCLEQWSDVIDPEPFKLQSYADTHVSVGMR